MAIAGMFSGLLGWLFVGAAIYSWLTYKDYSSSSSPQASFSDPGVGGGPWAHPTSSQTPIPLVFGTARSTMPIIHYRLEGDQYQDMWLVCAVCEDWSSLDPDYATAVGEVWLNDTRLSRFARYTANPDLYDRDHDWCRFYPIGRGCNIYWKSDGKHVFQKEAKLDVPAESYSLQATHDAGTNPIKCTVRLIHQFKEGGTTQNFKVTVYYSTVVSGSPEIVLFNGSVFKTATQTVEAGKDSETINVAGTQESVYNVNLPYKGTFKVKVELVSASNEGQLYLDSVELEDTAVQSETVESYGTSLLVVHIRDVDGTLVKPTVTGMVTGGPSNPAVALLWLLKNKEVSLGIGGDYIDEVSFTEAAAKCDEYGYTFNRAYCSGSNFESVISDMVKSGRLLLGEYGGKLACVFDEEVPALNTRMVDMMTMADNANYGDTSIGNIPNRFVIKYVDSAVESTAQDIVLEDIVLQQKAGVVNEKMIDLYGITTQVKAWELGWYHAHWAQASKWLEFDMKPMLWDLSPSSVITTVSTEDPYLNNREWMLVGFDETEPNHYRAKAIEYKRSAFHAEGYIEEIPNVYIEDYVPTGTPNSPNVPSGTVAISIASIQPLPSMESRVTLQLAGVPDNADFVKVYRSFDGNSYSLLTELTATGGTQYCIYNESQSWTFVWYKATIRSSKGETSLIGAPSAQAYITGAENTFPGFGVGAYGRQPYGY